METSQIEYVIDRFEGMFYPGTVNALHLLGFDMHLLAKNVNALIHLLAMLVRIRSLFQ